MAHNPTNDLARKKSEKDIKIQDLKRKEKIHCLALVQMLKSYGGVQPVQAL